MLMGFINQLTTSQKVSSHLPAPFSGPSNHSLHRYPSETRTENLVVSADFKRIVNRPLDFREFASYIWYVYIYIILMYVHVCSMFLGVNHLREQESRLNTLDICRCTVQWLSWRPLRWSLHCMVEWLDDLGLEPWLKGTPHDPMCL